MTEFIITFTNDTQRRGMSTAAPDEVFQRFAGLRGVRRLDVHPATPSTWADVKEQPCHA